MLEVFKGIMNWQKDNSSDDSVIKNKSVFNPPRNRDKTLDKF